jgi:hypothetical protein
MRWSADEWSSSDAQASRGRAETLAVLGEQV